MSTLEIILLITSLSLLALYVTSKIGKNQSLNEVITLMTVNYIDSDLN